MSDRNSPSFWEWIAMLHRSLTMGFLKGCMWTLHTMADELMTWDVLNRDDDDKCDLQLWHEEQEEAEEMMH